MGRKKTLFDDSLWYNMETYNEYVKRLLELSVSMFEWKNLPNTVNPRYLETTLFQNGLAVFFPEPDIGYLGLTATFNGYFNVYGDPTIVRAYSKYNGFQREVMIDTPERKGEGVVIWNNYLHTPCTVSITQFAKRLATLDRIIDINCNAQKTPVAVIADEKQRLTMLNLYKEYDGNAPFIFGNKSLDLNGLKAISTGAPYVSDKLYQLKNQIWNEALTYLGISNISVSKKERMITDEVQRAQGGVIASRYGRLSARQEACEHINRLFDLNISVDYRNDYSTATESEGAEDE